MPSPPKRKAVIVSVVLLTAILGVVAAYGAYLRSRANAFQIVEPVMDLVTLNRFDVALRGTSGRTPSFVFVRNLSMKVRHIFKSVKLLFPLVC